MSCLRALLCLTLAQASQIPALIRAVLQRDVDSLQAKLAAGADIDEADDHGSTPLMWAVALKSTEMVEVILAHGPNVNMQSRDGWSALMAAADFGTPKMVEAVLSKGPNLNLQEKDGATALAIAAEFGYDRRVEALLEAKASVDLPDFAGRSPLFLAAQQGHLETVELLLDHGARPEVIARNGQTPLQIAEAEAGRSSGHEATSPASWLDGSYGKVVEVLQKKTPTGFALFLVRVSAPEFYQRISLALLGGIIAGAMWYQVHQYLMQGAVGTGARKVALKAAAPRQGFYKTRRGLEVIATVVFPLGVTMLFISVKFMVPIYALLYILPRLLEIGCSGAMRHPALLLCGGQGLSSILRLMATTFFLVLVAMQPNECEDDIQYYLFGNERRADLDHPWSTLMARGVAFLPPLLNRASAQMACPDCNTMPAPLKSMYLGVLCCIWSLSVVWVLWTLLEILCVGTEPLSREEEEVAQELERQLLSTATAEEVSQVSCGTTRARAEPAFSCSPLPGGLYFAIAMAVLDGLMLDLVSIFNLMMAGQYQLASLSASVLATFTVAGLLTARQHSDLQKEPEKSVAKGIMTEPLTQLLELEASFKAPVSFMLTCYSWSFAIRNWLSLGSGVFSLLFGVHALADAIYWTEDVRLSNTCWRKSYRALHVEINAGDAAELDLNLSCCGVGKRVDQSSCISPRSDRSDTWSV